MKYSKGIKISCNDIIGIIIPNFKIPGDICVEWETGLKTSYDKNWLDENVTIIEV